MGLKDVYYKIEDKYYAFLDWMDSKGFHLPYAVDDWLQQHNIPSFPLISAIFLLIVILIVYLALFMTGAVGTQDLNVIMKFQDITKGELVPDLQVVLTVDGDNVTKTTDPLGEIALITPLGQPVTLNVLDSSYELETSSYSFSEDGQTQIVKLKNKDASLLSRTIRLFEDVTSSALFQEEIELSISCTDNLDYEKNITAYGGSIVLQDIPADCGNLIVSAPALGFSETISASVADPYVEISANSLSKGSILVSCVDNEGNPLPNITISAINSNDVRGADAVTQSSGTTTLDVPVGKYYLVANDLSQTYSAVNTKEELGSDNYFYESVNADQELAITLTFNKQSLGFIVLKVTDASGKAVSGGKVIVYKNESSWSTEGTLDASGQFRYGVGELVPYRVVIDHPQYMIKEISELYPSEVARNVSLDPITSNPILLVKVLGSDVKPVANATVQIFRNESGEELPVLNGVTGADGTFEFRRLQAGLTYTAKVFKGEYSAVSNEIILDARKTNELPITLNIGNGDVSVVVYDATGIPVQGADVEFYDSTDDKQIGITQSTNEAGYATISARGDNIVYAKVYKSGFSEFYTLALPAQVGLNVELEAYLVEKSASPAMELLGVYDLAGNELEGTPVRLTRGTSYVAKFLLKVPEGVPYDSGEVFFKMDDVKNLAQSSLFVNNIYVLKGVVEKGTTYTSPNGYAEDMINRVSGNGLWGVAKVDRIKSGTYMVEINFSTVSQPTKNTLSLSYRAALKNGSSYARAPVDESLGNTLSTGTKHGMYANTEVLNVLVGDAICSNIFCGEFEVTDSLGNSSKLYDSYFAGKNGKYSLKIVNLFSITQRQFSGASLEIYNETGAIEFSGAQFRINGTNANVVGSAKKLVINIDEVNKTLSLTGSFDMIPVKEGLIPLYFKILDKDGTVLFEHNAEITVDPAGNMMVSLVPSVIVPFVNNAALILVSDSETTMPIDYANISISNNDVIVASGKTDYEGRFAFELAKPNVGDELKINVDASGYNKVTKSIIINENILVAEPSELDITIDRTAKDYLESYFVLKNVTGLQLKLTSMKFALGEFDDYITIDMDNSNVGKIIDSNVEISYRADLTKLGKVLLEPKDFETALLVDVESRDLGKKWNISIPVNIYIKLRGSLDSEDCLYLEPALDENTDVWNIVLTNSGESVEQNYIIYNECTYNSEPISLYNAELSVSLQGKELGKFNYENTELGKKSVMIFDEIMPGETPITISFTGNSTTIADQTKAYLVLNAVHGTDAGVQTVTDKAEVNVIVSDLTKCIEVIGPNGNLNGLSVNNVPVVVLGVNPYGLGYSMYNQYMGYDPYGLSYSSLGSSYLPTGSGYPNTVTDYGSSWNYYNAVGSGLNNRGGYNDPTYSTYTNPNLLTTNPNAYYNASLSSYGNYGYSGLNYNMGYGTTSLPPIASIEIKNKCAYPVNVYVRSTSQLLVDATTLELPAKMSTSQKITLQSTYYTGAYTVSLLGSYNGLDTIPILDIPVNVIDLELEGAMDCFKLDSGNTIDFSGFVEMIKEVKLYNNCYMKGVVLGEPSVAMQNLIVSQSDLQGVTIGSEKAPYVTATAYKPNVEASSTYGKIQVSSVFLKKSLAIQKPERTGPTKDNLGGMIDKLSNLRVSSAQQYMSIQFPAIFIINYSIGRGSAGTTNTYEMKVTVVDNWNWAGFADILEDFLETGNPNCKPNTWNKHLTNTATIENLEDEDFIDGVAEIPYADYYQILDLENCFGSFDSVIFRDTGYDAPGGYFKVCPVEQGSGVSFRVVALKEVPVKKDPYKIPKMDFRYKIDSYHFPDAKANTTFSHKGVIIRVNEKIEEASADAKNCKFADITKSSSSSDSSTKGSLDKSKLSVAQARTLTDYQIKTSFCKKLLDDSDAMLLSDYLKKNPQISFKYGSNTDVPECDVFDDGTLCDAQQFFLSIKQDLSNMSSIKKICDEINTKAVDYNTCKETCVDPKVCSEDKTKCSSKIETTKYLQTSSNTLIELKPTEVFFPDDVKEIGKSIESVLRPDVTKEQFMNLRKIIKEKLNGNDYGNLKLGDNLDLFFKTNSTKGSCPSGSFNMNGSCYLRVDEDLDVKKLVAWFGKDMVASKLSAYETVFLVKFRTCDELSILEKYYIANYLSKGKPYEFGMFMSYLKKDELLSSYYALKNQFASSFDKELTFDNAIISKSGMYVVMISSDSNLEQTLIKEIKSKDILYDLVFDPYEHTSSTENDKTSLKKNSGMVLYTGEAYKLSEAGIMGAGEESTTMLLNPKNKDEIGADVKDRGFIARHTDGAKEKLGASVEPNNYSLIIRKDTIQKDDVAINYEIVTPRLNSVVKIGGQFDEKELYEDWGALQHYGDGTRYKECDLFEVANGTFKVLYCDNEATIEPIDNKPMTINGKKYTDDYDISKNKSAVKSFGLHTIWVHPDEYCISTNTDSVKIAYVPKSFVTSN